MAAKDTGMNIVGSSPTTIVFKIRCMAIVELVDLDDEEDDYTEYTGGNVFREEWVVYREFRDFNTLHKFLKTQVAVTETSGTASSRLVGVATAAFAVGGGAPAGERRRKALIPSLGQAVKVGALGITPKAAEKRRAVLHSYLQYLLAPSHPMRLCTEILTFLGAFHPFPPEVQTGEIATSVPDALGRVEMIRSVHHENESSFRVSGTPAEESERDVSERSAQETIGESIRSDSESLRMRFPSAGESIRSIGEDESIGQAQSSRSKTAYMDPAIKARIDQVPLGKVRHAIFEIIRATFALENASFFRNRLLAAIKTLSFAVASNGAFTKTLYETHKSLLSADAIAGWIEMGLDMLWPDGVFYESSPASTPEESQELADKVKTLLTSAFPDQVRSVLGSNIADDGVLVLHEMLQNRAVLKSLFYMFFDILWLEIFPEFQDFLTGAEALENDY